MDFIKKTACITGAAAGIGRAAAIKFAQKGANVVLIDMNEEKLASVKKEVERYTPNVIALKCDISDEAQVYETFQKAESIFQKIDILINNAAIWRDMNLFEDISTDTWHKFIDINILGTVYCTKAVLTKMLESGYGKIVNIASVAGVYGNASMTHYSATKGAVISLTKALAKEVADKGINVNCVSPGSVSPADNLDMDFYQDSELSFMGRTGTDNENAELICFLASDEAAYIAGQNIQIDGCRKKM